jgi:ribosomal protein L32
VSTLPIVRSAIAILPPVAKAKFAESKAKQMMGNANPLTGADIRKPASTQCPSCHRWHRPGVVCPNSTKSMEALFRSHGEQAIPNQPIGPMQPPASIQALLQELAPPMPQPQPQPAQMLAPPVDPVPIAPQGAQGLLNYQAPAVPSPATPQQLQQQLTDSSPYLQGQNQSYLNALRNWQAKYGGQ